MGVVRSTDRQAGESNFSGIVGKVLLDPDAGAGAVTLGELLINPGAELPLHKHLVEEAFFVFEGEGLALIGEDEIPVSAGDAVLAPTTVYHGFRNTADTQLKMAFFYPAVNPATEFK